MFKKRNPDHLEPIKTTKTEANYQMLLLEMMGKLVSETKESNRLLKKVAGEESHKTQKLPFLTPVQSKKQSYETESGKNVSRQSHHESEGGERELSEGGLHAEDHSQYSYSTSKDRVSLNRIDQDFFTRNGPIIQNNQQVVKKLDSLASIMQKIEEHMASAAKERLQDRVREKEREKARMKQKEQERQEKDMQKIERQQERSERQRERERERQRERQRQRQRQIEREREKLRQKQRQLERQRDNNQKQKQALQPKPEDKALDRPKSRLNRASQGKESNMLESAVIQRPKIRKEQLPIEKKEDDLGLFEAENINKKKIDINKLSTFRKTRMNWDRIQNKQSVHQSPQVAKSSLNHNQLANKAVFENIIKLSDNVGDSDVSPTRPDIEKQLQQRKNYAMLSEILPYSDRRQIKIKFSVEDIYNFYKSKGESIDLNKITQQWLGLVYRATTSICWNMLSNHLLNFEQIKILFTQNIIYNFIEFMKSTQVLGFGSYRVQLVQNINVTATNILDFLCTQYPQTKIEDPNIALRAQIPSIDNKGQVKYDFIGRACKNKIIKMRKKRNGDYTSEIMKLINSMIDKSNEQYDSFATMMNDIFEEIFLPYKKRKLAEKPEDNSQLQMYYEKVKTYTKFVIGRKINKNTPKYTKPEIENGVFFVKSASILRLLTKWVEQLDDIVRNPEKQIKNSDKQFKDDDGLPIHLYAQIKNGVYKAIKENQQHFYNKIKNIKRQCYNMEVLLTLSNFITDPDQIHLSEEQISVGKYCSYLKSAIASYICSELNQLIDFLLEIPGTVDETKIGISDPLFQEQARKDLDNLNLVGFKIFDLLRCKCVSKESQIIYLLRRLNEKSNDINDPFHIVRIKDRLGTGTRDILINAQINKGVVCEIQLAVVSNMEKKQELLDQYNHFLYELKRAKLGSITQSASIWSTLEQRAKFFESSIDREQMVCDGKVPHPCITDHKKPDLRKLSKFPRPIICASCNNFFEIPRTCLSNIKCEECAETYCGECHYQHLKEDQRKDFVFEKLFFKCLFPFIRQYNDYSKPLPRCGFLFRKLYLKKQLFFYRVIAKKSQNAQSSNSMNIEIVYSGVEQGQFFNKTINKVELQAKQIEGELYVQDSSKKRFQNFIIYELVKFGKGTEMVTIAYKELFNHFDKLKIRFVNLMKHPVYVEDIKLFKKPKIIERQIQGFKNILKEDTMITYLKVYRTVFILQVEVDQNILQKELVKIININRLRSYANDKSNSVSMEFRDVTDQMDLIKTKFPPALLASFSQRLTKLYLNFGMVESLGFVQLFSNMKVLYVRNNRLDSLKGVETLKNLGVICFDNNMVTSMEPLTQLVNMTQISGTGNLLQSLNGIQNLIKLKKVHLFNNKFKKIQFFENHTNIQELSLNHNPIEKIESILHLKTIQELSLGKTLITDLQPLSNFKNIKKIALNGLTLKNIGPIFKQLENLLRLNLSNNQIEKMQNLEQLTQLIELNLRQNNIKKIQGLANCVKLQILKLGYNFITDVSGIKALDNLKILKLANNPLIDCSEVHFMSRRHFKLIYSKMGEAENETRQPSPEFYERYNAVLEHRISSSSGSGSNDSDSD